ncbi:sucrose-6-phosphate hydrolase [Ligilactobacillus acidipiscis]|uniref:sucrose-6-phosphate hydrolase n=1 Tax=Ligilactobacillus acidipiscis TaxID=89059 RepID=UPI003D79C8EB
MDWPKEKKYADYSTWNSKTLLALQSEAQNSDFYPKYHISPSSGLLNDPNGFSFFNNQWHVFHQFYPFGPVHGLKSWNHLISNDLVHWENKGVALYPDNKYDNYGVYSGSAIPFKDYLFLMYTGNSRDKRWNRTPYQLGCILDRNGAVQKLSKPLIEKPTIFTEHFRDPQIIKHNNEYFALIGAQKKANKQGEISFFKSQDLINWSYIGVINFKNKLSNYMIECPNLIFINNQPLLIYCPQGAKVALNSNIYPNVFVIGKSFNFSSGYFDSENKPQPIDMGFDNYATQAFTAPNGKSYSISWAGLPEIEYPTDKENWAHCLSVVKELSIKDNRLIQRPVSTLKKLRYNEVDSSSKVEWNKSLAYNTNNQYELKLHIAANQADSLFLTASKNLQKKIIVNFNTGRNAYLSVDRSKIAYPFAQDYGTKRSISLPANHTLDLDIFVDHSICEIFVNGGQQVLTLRFFTDKQDTKIFLSQKLKVKGKFWKMENI